MSDEPLDMPGGTGRLWLTDRAKLTEPSLAYCD
jgi:hypothetical protein